MKNQNTLLKKIPALLLTGMLFLQATGVRAAPPPPPATWTVTKTADNNDGTANFLSLYSGNAPLASRPQLIVEYYIP